jgi:hypothetical protein
MSPLMFWTVQKGLLNAPLATDMAVAMKRPSRWIWLSVKRRSRFMALLSRQTVRVTQAPVKSLEKAMFTSGPWQPRLASPSVAPGRGEAMAAEARRVAMAAKDFILIDEGSKTVGRLRVNKWFRFVSGWIVFVGEAGIVVMVMI